MRMTNTSCEQDRQIDASESSSHISNLIDIIRDFDEVITRWVRAAEKMGCDSPEELAAKAERMEEGGAE